jgi:hypothetical protein
MRPVASRDTRYEGAPADIESPPQLIEVKSFGTSNRGYDLWLEVRQVEEVKANPHFYVYVVETSARAILSSSHCGCSVATGSGACWSGLRSSDTTPSRGPWPTTTPFLAWTAELGTPIQVQLSTN